jgi:hypothetical protein
VTKKCTLPRERQKPPNEKSEFGSESPQSWDLGSIPTAPTNICFINNSLWHGGESG